MTGWWERKRNMKKNTDQKPWATLSCCNWQCYPWHHFSQWYAILTHIKKVQDPVNTNSNWSNTSQRVKQDCRVVCSQAARPLGCDIQQGDTFCQSLRKAMGQSNTIVPSYLCLHSNPHPSISGSQFILFSGTNLSFPGGKLRQGSEPH